MTTETSTAPSVAMDETERFGSLAEQWWQPEGPFRPLHHLNPARMEVLADIFCHHFNRSLDEIRPFAGKTLLDIGCGGGLVSEPCSRLGFAVTGIDADGRNVAAAKAHAEQSGLKIDYRSAAPEDLSAEGKTYDVVLALEVIEHVADVDSFTASLAGLLTESGVLVLSTINRTAKSFLLAKVGAEYVLRWVPAGTHDWRKFMKPSEIAAALRRQGLSIRETVGLTYDLMEDRWRPSPDISVNYILSASR